MAAKISSPWDPRQLVLPGALWHDHWADCKHRTSRSGLVPTQWLHKHPYLHRLFNLTTSKAQATSPNVCQSSMCIFVCVHSRSLFQNRATVCATGSNPRGRMKKHTLLGFTQVNYLAECDSVNLLLGTSLYKCTASWHIQYFPFVVANIFSFKIKVSLKPVMTLVQRCEPFKEE